MRNNSYFIDVGAVCAVVDVQQRLIYFFGQKSAAAMAATAATLPMPLQNRLGTRPDAHIMDWEQDQMHT